MGIGYWSLVIPVSTRAWDIVPFVPLKAGARQMFSYLEPRGTRLAPGIAVRVPFGPRAVSGFVWRRATGKPRPGMKHALGVAHDQPLFHPIELRALERLAEASLESLGLLAKAAAGVRRVSASVQPVRLTEKPRRLNESRRGGAPDVIVRWDDVSRVFPKNTLGQTLVLVPELAIGHRVLGVLNTLKIPAALFAQGLRVRERRAVISRLVAGEPLAVVTTHVGVFLPFPALEHIVVVEAALPSHRQWDLHPRYDARVAALLLARERSIPLTLQSSLPSLDLLALQQIKGKTQHAKREAPTPIRSKLNAKRWTILPRSAHDPLVLPDTLSAVRETLSRGGRALLFHDIVGTERVFSCETCGHMLRCASCAGMLERQGSNLQCRLCGLPAGRVPNFCPRCKSPHLSPRRIGTISLVEDLQRQFPDASVVRADRETLPRAGAAAPSSIPPASITVMTERGFAALGQQFDCLAVLEADQLLQDPAPDAEERFLQVVTRLAGYGSAWTRLLLQTTHPHLRSVQALAAGDLSGWAQQELEDREALGYPPHAALLRLEQSFPTQPRALSAVQKAVERLSTPDARLKTGYRLAGSPPRVRAELLLRGSLRELQRVLPSLPFGWSADPHIPLTVLAHKTSDVGR